MLLLNIKIVHFGGRIKRTPLVCPKLPCDLQVLLAPISEHKTGVTKTISLYSYLRFCGNIMCIAGPNDNLWLTKFTGMDTNGCDMPNESNFAFFGEWGVFLVRMGAKWRIWDVVVIVILEIKTTVFTRLLNSEGCNSFPKHLNLAQARNKTNGVFKKQWNTQYHDKSWHIVTCLAVFRLYICIGALASEGGKRVDVSVLTAA